MPAQRELILREGGREGGREGEERRGEEGEEREREKCNSRSGYLCKVNNTFRVIGVVRASGSTYGRSARANKISSLQTKYCFIIRNCFMRNTIT